MRGHAVRSRALRIWPFADGKPLPLSAPEFHKRLVTWLATSLPRDRTTAWRILERARGVGLLRRDETPKEKWRAHTPKHVYRLTPKGRQQILDWQADYQREQEAVPKPPGSRAQCPKDIFREDLDSSMLRSPNTQSTEWGEDGHATAATGVRVQGESSSHQISDLTVGQGTGVPNHQAPDQDSETPSPVDDPLAGVPEFLDDHIPWVPYGPHTQYHVYDRRTGQRVEMERWADAYFNPTLMVVTYERGVRSDLVDTPRAVEYLRRTHRGPTPYEITMLRSVEEAAAAEKKRRFPGLAVSQSPTLSPWPRSEEGFTSATSAGEAFAIGKPLLDRLKKELEPDLFCAPPESLCRQGTVRFYREGRVLAFLQEHSEEWEAAKGRRAKSLLRLARQRPLEEEELFQLCNLVQNGYLGALEHWLYQDFARWNQEWVKLNDWVVRAVQGGCTPESIVLTVTTAGRENPRGEDAEWEKRDVEAILARYNRKPRRGKKRHER